MNVEDARSLPSQLVSRLRNIYQRFQQARQNRLNNEDRNANTNINNDIIQYHNQIFQAIFFKVTLNYAKFVPYFVRRLIEFSVILMALLSFILLSYAHWTFLRPNPNCVKKLAKHWVHDGVLRVVIENSNFQSDRSKNDLNKLHLNSDFKYTNQSLLLLNDDFLSDDDYNKANTRLLSYDSNFEISDEKYVSAIEFSFEYGYLRLSEEIRKKFKLPVITVTLDRETDICFGNPISRFILNDILGYDSLLVSNLKDLSFHLSDHDEDNRGYLRNIKTGEHFIFVKSWSPMFAYIAAFFGMVLFSLISSMILRYSHHEIFLLTVNVIHLFEFNTTFEIPLGPILTVILSLVGMETLASEFFNDNTIAFYAILMVWFADQYNSICCSTTIAKKHWLKFFFLYQYVFYAYQFRFGHYNKLALITFWLFILLPYILTQARVSNLLSRFDGRHNTNQAMYAVEIQGHQVPVINNRSTFTLRSLRYLYITTFGRFTRRNNFDTIIYRRLD